MLDKSAYVSSSALLCQLPVYYQPWFLDLSADEWDVWIEEKEEYICVFPFYIEKKNIFKLSRPVAPIMPYYGPFIITKNERAIDHKKIESAIKRCIQSLPRFSEIYLTPHHEHSYEVYDSMKFTAKERVTHLLDLQQTEEKLWEDLDYMRKKNIKQAQKTLIIKEGEFDVEMYYDWIKKTYQKRGQELKHSLDIYTNFVNSAINHNAAICATIYNSEHEPIAVSFCLKDAAYGYSILGANHPEIKNSAATTALLWHSILQSKLAGCHTFDFEGSNIESIAQFFKKFGATAKPYKAWYKTNSLLWKLKKKIV